MKSIKITSRTDEALAEYRATANAYREAANAVVKAYTAARENGTPAGTVSAAIRAVGYDMAAAIVATLTASKSWDGRISKAAADWAQTVPEAVDNDTRLRFNIPGDTIHPAHLDQIAREFAKTPRPEPTTEAEAEPTTEEAQEATEAEKTFPRLCAEVNAAATQEAERTAFYIKHGYMTTWAESSRKGSDNGLKRYSTARRWEQYQRGEITKEKAVDLATRRAMKEVEKHRAALMADLEAAATAPAFDSVSVFVTWAKSRIWGANPTAEVLNQGDRRTIGHASGCGCDKESAAIAEALNANPAALRVLYELGEAALALGKSQKSKTACTGYSWGCCIGYGAGYGVLPYFEGGVGSECFWRIFRDAGFKVCKVASGKMFDCWELVKPAA